MPKCKACNAEIRFVTTKAGKKMPVDVDPPWNAKAQAIETMYGSVEWLVPHWSTCTDPGRFKKEKSK